MRATAFPHPYGFAMPVFISYSSRNTSRLLDVFLLFMCSAFFRIAKQLPMRRSGRFLLECPKHVLMALRTVSRLQLQFVESHQNCRQLIHPSFQPNHGYAPTLACGPRSSR
jgi:hypothetical protein